MAKKWWTPKNDRGNGFRGATHAVQNILTESLRLLMTKIHINPNVGKHDLAYWLSHAITVVALVYLLGVVIGGAVIDYQDMRRLLGL